MQAQSSAPQLESYARAALGCLNALFRRMRLPSRLSQLSQVTPDVVRALAEFHFDRKPDPLIPFLEHEL